VALLSGVFLAVCVGCTENTPPSQSASPPPKPPPLVDEPISVQIRRAEPRLASLPFRVLLDFEKPLDLSFLDKPGAAVTDPAKAHTGKSSLRLDKTTTRDFAVKLSSLVGSGFPGSWTVAGAFFYCDEPATVNVSYAPAPGQPLALPARGVRLIPGRWTPVMVDLTALGESSAGGAGTLSFSIDSGATVFCDDVILINNDKSIAPRITDAQDPPWSVRQRGFAITAARPARFKLTLRTVDDRPEDGWAMLEANELRARFASGDGQEMTLYADGRQYIDGKLTILGPTPRYAETLVLQQDNPADLEIAEEFGRIDRDTPGDRNNDGYNERRGAYQLVAKGPTRLEVTLKPRTAQIAVPVLEIAGLKPGRIFVTVEGQMIDHSARLDDGKVLIDLPLILHRQATVNVSVK
jgi:hypothetical protein